MNILNTISRQFVRNIVFKNRMNYNCYSSMTSTVQHGKLINDDVTNSFLLPLDSEMAQVNYEKKNGILNLFHTEVPETYRNQGLGEVLAKEVFDYCVKRNLKIQLSCGYLKYFYDNNPLPEYKALVVR